MSEKKEKKQESWVPLLCNYPNSKKVNSVSFEAETMFTRILAQCDDNGNYDADPALLVCGLFSERFRFKMMDVTKALRLRDELVTAKLIELYSVGGETYLHVVEVKKCSRKDVAKDIRFPEMPQVSENKELPAPVTDTLRIRNENETLEQNRTDKNRIEHITTLSDSRFDRFWKVYPKKIGKGAAEKSFVKIKPTEELLQKMISVIEEQKRSQQWLKDGGQYIPNPSTWLNQKRWEDEIINTGANNAGSQQTRKYRQDTEYKSAEQHPNCITI